MPDVFPRVGAWLVDGCMALRSPSRFCPQHPIVISLRLSAPMRDPPGREGDEREGGAEPGAPMAHPASPRPCARPRYSISSANAAVSELYG
jgi:hypothetical protein